MSQARFPAQPALSSFVSALSVLSRGARAVHPLSTWGVVGAQSCSFLFSFSPRKPLLLRNGSGGETKSQKLGFRIRLRTQREGMKDTQVIGPIIFGPEPQDMQSENFERTILENPQEKLGMRGSDAGHPECEHERNPPSVTLNETKLLPSYLYY